MYLTAHRPKPIVMRQAAKPAADADKQLFVESSELREILKQYRLVFLHAAKRVSADVNGVMADLKALVILGYFIPILQAIWIWVGGGILYIYILYYILYIDRTKGQTVI